MTEFTSRAAAFEEVRTSLPDDLRGVLDDEDARSLVELFFASMTSESLLLRTEQTSEDNSGGKGHGAYVPRYGLIINEKKAMILLSALLADILLSNGLASFGVSQAIKDPSFIRRVTSEQHLMCVLSHDQWSELSFPQFESGLVEGKCKNPTLTCGFQRDGLCSLGDDDFNNQKETLSDFFRIT